MWKSNRIGPGLTASPGRRAEVRDGRAHVTYKNRKNPADWDVIIKDHHVGYIEWEEYQRNQAQLAKNAFGRKGGVKSGRGGGALLASILCCARCGRRLHVVYTGHKPRPVYRYYTPNLLLGRKRCLTFGGRRADELITNAVLGVLAPHAIKLPTSIWQCPRPVFRRREFPICRFATNQSSIGPIVKIAPF